MATYAPTAEEIVRRSNEMSAAAGDAYVSITWPLGAGPAGCALVREVARLAGVVVEETPANDPRETIVSCSLRHLRDGMRGHVTVQGVERRSEVASR